MLHTLSCAIQPAVKHFMELNDLVFDSLLTQLYIELCLFFLLLVHTDKINKELHIIVMEEITMV